MSKLLKTLTASITIGFLVSCGVMDSLDTTNRNTTEMNEDMDHMVDGVDNMGLKTEEMNDAMTVMIDTMADMRDTMAEMNQTMDKMNETMDQMSGKMQDMQEDIVELGTDARQGVSLAVRTQAWDRLNNSRSVDAKLSAASAYHMAFEFQTWKGTGLDTLERREKLFYDGLAEYYRNIYGVADQNNWSLNVLSKANGMNTLYALAGTLEKINANQSIFLKNGEKEASFLNLFQEAIVSFKASNEPSYDIELLPEYLEEAAEFRQLTIYLLNLRHNILSGLVISKLARMDKATNRVAELMRQGRTVFPWKPNMTEYSKNSGMLKRIMMYINMANETRDFLCKHSEPEDTGSESIQMRMNGLLKSAINKMELDQTFIDTVIQNQPGQPELAKQFVKSVFELKASVNMHCSTKDEDKTIANRRSSYTGRLN